MRRPSWQASGQLLLVGSCLSLAGGCTSLAPFDAGFFASRDTDLRGNDRARAAGPIWEERHATNALSFKAVRPLFSTERNETRTRTDLLWPVGTFNTGKKERSWRVLNVIGHDFDTADPGSRYRVTAFPLFSMGRDAKGQSYAGFFPLGGRINEFMGQDETSFILFPLYARTARDDVSSLHVLWPFYARTRGGDIYRHRVFPFYGTSERKDDRRKRFILWPFWTDVRYDDTRDPGKGFLLFPIYGSVRTEKQHSWTVLPPLFRATHTPSRYELQAPWPFFRYSRGDVDKLYFWPIWGTREQGPLRRSFLLWPIGRASRVERNDETRKTLTVLPVLHTERATARNGSVTERYFKLWPLFMYRRVGDASMVRSLALSPFKHSPPVERNYAPLWSLYTYEHRDHASEHELLWGFVRKRETAQGKSLSIFPLWSQDSTRVPERGLSCSIRTGLVVYERQGLKKGYRLLYFIRIGSAGEPSEEETGD